jgi:23S rRNA (cytidine1920-2'-O)/16S rRNA (cytidine1409-2'-O)-methyltransferase
VEFFVWLRRGPAVIAEEVIHSHVLAADPLADTDERVDP